MKLKTFLAYSLLLLQLCGCVEKHFKQNQVRSVIFGWFAGMSKHGSLAFKYESGNLYVDTTASFFLKQASKYPDKYNWTFLQKISSSTINNVIETVPYRYVHTDGVFGRPDDFDQGGTFIILYYSEGYTYLELDNNLDRIPKDLRKVSNRINNATDELRKIYKIW